MATTRPDRPSIRRALPHFTSKPHEELALERGLLTGIAALRWAAWAWAAIAFGIDASRGPATEHAGTGMAVLAVALAWTGLASVLVRRDPSRLLDWWAIAVELTIAIVMVVIDPWVYGAQNIHSQSLGSVWPLAAVFTAGVSGAGRAGFVAGLGIGTARLAGQLVFDRTTAAVGENQLGAAGTIVLFSLAGGIAGFLAIKLREAEREIAVARAREEVARTLHDGVLQTLALVQRRAIDDDLVALAREQEHQLREFLFSKPDDPKRLFHPATEDLAGALRDVAAEAERRHRLRCQVVVGGEPGSVPVAVADAIGGAVREALTNASKHGSAQHATIYLEGEDGHGIFCSVKDDGCGFEPSSVSEGEGTTRSIRARIADIGGTVEIEGRPDRGVEVVLRWP